MNDADMSKQIQQMARFIRQEAEERVNEISVSAEEEFNIEKLQLVEAEKKKIRQEYEHKTKQVEVRKKDGMDTTLVKSVLEEAKKEYAEKAKVKAPSITIDNNVYLPSILSGANSHAPSCSGGVVLASHHGKIVCENTLNAQLDVVFQ